MWGSLYACKVTLPNYCYNHNMSAFSLYENRINVNILTPKSVNIGLKKYILAV